MTPKDIEDIIDKYLKGTASIQELKRLKEFEEFAENNVQNQVFKNNFDKEKLKSEIFYKVKKKKNTKNIFFYKVSIAASIILLVSIAVFNKVFYKNDVEINTVAYSKVVKEANYGEKLKITLPDGSKVILNSGSKIEYTKPFSDSVRNVALIGEAFFNVEKNAKKPFTIQTSGLTTTVLGTTFSIDAYPKQNNIKITLATGKVKVNNTKDSVFLAPSQQATFNIEENTISTKKVDIEKYIEWKDGVLRFENATLSEMIPKLEKWYNVKIKLVDSALLECRFTAIFRKERLETILKHLVFVKPSIEYRIVSEKEIELTGKCSN